MSAWSARILEPMSFPSTHLCPLGWAAKWPALCPWRDALVATQTNKQPPTLRSSSGHPLPLEALLAGGTKLFYYVNTQKFYPASCILHLLRICLILHDWYEIALIGQIAFPEGSFPETYYRACWPRSLAKGFPAVGLYSTAALLCSPSGQVEDQEGTVEGNVSH